MKSIPGYAGRILRADLTTEKLVSQEFTKELALTFLGGSGLGTKILWDEVSPEIEPFSPDNELILAVGPLSATIYPTAGRFEVITKSPLTGIYGDANGGGHFAPKMKQSGFDAVVVRGRADHPVYVWLNDGKAEIRDGTSLWGKGTVDTEKVVREELGDPLLQVASIGQAGENLVRYAAVMNEGCAAARSGVGAVMGSKNLKAFAAQGYGEVPSA
ncbi:MAG TPA: aldehyde ferredoxin oxidoreductase N-terminal domain-containing protein, partial [Terriglobales bacterium]|nr:aldehyde ferredoxin oxidoreductase N-terminal domain-containing protein [Terriglobales bacterium]